ncbi:MAG: deiodinase-like protein [Pseudomonadota bacterium]
MKASAKSYNYDAFANDFYEARNFIDGAPHIGECAPDFEAHLLNGKTAKLSDWNGQTIVLETGSLTCPIFAGNSSAMEALRADLSDKAAFLVLYVREAHPGTKRPAHRSDADKMRAAQETANVFAPGRTILVDDTTGSVHKQWGQLPNSVWIIGPDGRVIYRTDWNDPDTVRDIISADDPNARARTYFEHRKQSMSLDLATRLFNHIKRYAGWNAVWHVVAEGLAMNRQHRHADAAQVAGNPVPRPARTSGCW